MTEDELLYEAAICIFGSQVLFEMSVATADRLRELGLLCPGPLGTRVREFEKTVAEALSVPLPIMNGDGTTRRMRPRFKNRLAFLLTSTIVELYEQSRSISCYLCLAGTAREARELLTQHVWGFGPKQASLFLRRVGYCDDLAVLDVHVLDYLRLARGLTLPSGRLGRLSCYEEVENTFREVAQDFGHSLGCVDLATWVTMRVAKREAFV